MSKKEKKAKIKVQEETDRNYHFMTQQNVLLKNKLIKKILHKYINDDDEVDDDVLLMMMMMSTGMYVCMYASSVSIFTV